MPPRLQEQFRGQVCDRIQEQFGIQNRLALPRLEKIILNVGVGNQLEGTKLNSGAREQVVSDLAAISGQKPVVMKARRAVSNFKTRRGFEVGVMVTLRRERMWEFLDRLINFAVPRIKDFRGLNGKSFDGRGNYSFGVQEQGVFPEVDMTSARFIHGMHITLVFSNSTDEISRAVLRELGMPFAQVQEQQQAAA